MPPTPDETGNTDRRIQDATAIATLTVQMSNLAASMVRVEAGQSELLRRQEARDEACRTCSSWQRIQVLETGAAANGVQLKKVDDHEQRLRFLELRVFGAAAGISVAIWLLDKFVLK